MEVIGTYLELKNFDMNGKMQMVIQLGFYLSSASFAILFVQAYKYVKKKEDSKKIVDNLNNEATIKYRNT